MKDSRRAGPLRTRPRRQRLEDDRDGGRVLTGAFVGGTVYVHALSGGTFVEEAILAPSDGATRNGFGHAVDTDGEWALVGASSDADLGPGAGAAYVFRRIGRTWTQTTKLTAPEGVALDGFGSEVALSGDLAAVSATLHDRGVVEARAVYLYRRTGADWSFEAKLTSPNPSVHGLFGNALAASGDRVPVGAAFEGLNDIGTSCVFEEVDGAWDTGFGPGRRFRVDQQPISDSRSP